MVFTSWVFVIFFITVYAVYLSLRKHLRAQNLLLLVASYVFYGWWDERFLFLIVLSTVIDYCSGLLLQHGKVERRQGMTASMYLIGASMLFVMPNWTLFREELTLASLKPDTLGLYIVPCTLAAVPLATIAIRWMQKKNEASRRKLALFVSVAANLGVLGFFKYCNFFIDSGESALNALGVNAELMRLDIVLPVGISFYTFQTMSYTIDIYRKRMEATSNFLNFALFVSFFPQLVAGPIERASHLLPQCSKPRRFDINQWQAGAYLVLWGFWKKLVVADNVAKVANDVFEVTYKDGIIVDYGKDGFHLVVGTLAFAFQIYCDFSAYSDIARGISKLMGFDLMLNFRLPYFAISPSDFWRRWHISLSTWLRDYLYIPLGGNRGGEMYVMRNLALTMLLGGLWHGNTWNFVLWGAFHGVILIVYRMIGIGTTPPGKPGTLKYHVSRYSLMAVMFLLTLVGWILFRCTEPGHIAYVFTHLSLIPDSAEAGDLMRVAFYVVPLILIQVWQQRTGDLLCMLRLPLPLRMIFCGWLVVWLLIFGVRVTSEFIYFQF